MFERLWAFGVNASPATAFRQVFDDLDGVANTRVAWPGVRSGPSPSVSIYRCGHIVISPQLRSDTPAVLTRSPVTAAFVKVRRRCHLQAEVLNKLACKAMDTQRQCAWSTTRKRQDSFCIGSFELFAKPRFTAYQDFHCL